MLSNERQPLIAGTSDEEFPQMVAVSDSSISAESQATPEVVADEEVLEYLVEIPEEIDSKGFSWRKLWAFTGPGFLMSIAYLDPGNIESDLQSGAVARYKLLWVLLVAHIVGFFLQRLSARLGVTSGKHMSEICREFFPNAPRIALWLMIEITIVCSDMQEVIGTSVAIYLLSNGRIPLIVGVLITIADTLTFLFIDRFGFRKLEGFFAFLIAVMAASFGFEFVTAKPDALALVSGFVPWCSDCGRKEFMTAIALTGAVIMPHNLYLHSALVRSRRIDRTKKNNVTEANFYYFIESGIALICSFVINLFVVGVFARGLYNKTNADMREVCANQTGILDPSVFANNTEPFDADLYKSGIFLGCQFGIMALYIWAVGILASGQSSTMTGTYAGQFVMEGFLHISWPRWQRVFVTRLIAILPTLTVTLFANGIHSLTGMNDLLNTVQMLQLPFALLPIISFTSSKHIMFEYRNTKSLQFLALLISFIVIAINLYFSTDYIFGNFGSIWYTYLAIVAPIVFYILFVGYLVVVCLITMEICSDSILKHPWLRPNFGVLSIQPLWHGNSSASTTNTPELYGSTGVTSIQRS
ncbi:NRAMP-like transporter smf-1 [Aphelenchoides besseyi]|nr:NRAMP-like transporter smf-1 [Aphelenchoides besseyi]KAI6235406.1 NRAMP-like transporter smf-1 [Aphelenchoides besseyi]